MWNKRSEDSHTPPPVKEHSSGVTPATPAGAGVRTAPPLRAAAIIGETMIVNGEIRSEEDIYIAGQVDGTLESQSSLTVGPSAKVKADIKAREVTIHGTVRGSVEVRDKITIHQNGSLVGDIKAAGIVIDDGAYFKGSIDIIRPPRNPPEIKEAPQPQLEPVGQHK